MKKFLTHWTFSFITLIALTFIGLQEPYVKEILKLKSFDILIQQEEKELEEEPNEISYDDAKKKGLENPDKADISKDKDISDYELKRGMAIQKAIEKQK